MTASQKGRGWQGPLEPTWYKPPLKLAAVANTRAEGATSGRRWPEWRATCLAPSLASQHGAGGEGTRNVQCGCRHALVPSPGCSAWLGSAVPISALSPVCPALPSTGAGGELGGRLKSCLSEGTPDIGVETSEGPGRMQSCVTCPWSHRKPVAETNQTLLAGYRARLDP